MLCKFLKQKEDINLPKEDEVLLQVVAKPYWSFKLDDISIAVLYYYDNDRLYERVFQYTDDFEDTSRDKERNDIRSLKKQKLAKYIRDYITNIDLTDKLLDFLKEDKDLINLKVEYRASFLTLDLNDLIENNEKLMKPFLNNLLVKGQGILEGIK